MKKKLFVYLLVSMISANVCCAVTVEASEIGEANVYYINGGSTRADVIVKKYRVYNGKRQYRRWNETRGKWVDSEWIDIKKTL